MKQVFVFGFVLVVMTGALAQTYNTAIGIRMDDGVNITGKQALVGKYMLEGMLHTPILSKDVGGSILVEKHRKLIGRNLSLYAGGGIHMYWHNSGKFADGEVTDKVLGISGIGGLDVCVGRLNLSVDVLPEIHLTGEPKHAFEFNGVAISARYIVDKKERKKLKDHLKLPKRRKQDRNNPPRGRKEPRRRI